MTPVVWAGFYPCDPSNPAPFEKCIRALTLNDPSVDVQRDNSNLGNGYRLGFLGRNNSNLGNGLGFLDKDNSNLGNGLFTATDLVADVSTCLASIRRVTHPSYNKAA